MARGAYGQRCLWPEVFSLRPAMLMARGWEEMVRGADGLRHRWTGVIVERDVLWWISVS